MGLLQMACILQMASISFLAMFSRGQQLQDYCSVLANPFTVGSTEDASILATSLGCSTGDFDVQWVGEIFVTETIRVTNGTSLRITGGGSSAAIADGRNATQLFVVDQGSSLHFSDMTFAHGNASFGGAINAFEARVSFSGKARFISNLAGVDGGAIFANRSTIFWDGDGTEFIFNSAVGYRGVGGAISAYGSNVSWDGDGTQFVSNFANYTGGAIYANLSTIFWHGEGTHFVSNSAGDKGGAIYAYESSMSCDSNDTQFISNSAENYVGGAIYLFESEMSWDGVGTVFSSNHANTNGGAIFVADFSNVFWYGDGTIFSSNSARVDGGAIFLDDEAFMFWDGDDTLFSFNSALGNGGAVEVADYSRMSWNGNGVQFNFNSANGSGGALHVDGSGVYWDGNYSVFSSNSANDSGGAIYATKNDFYLTWNGDDTLFSSNSAGINGGAIVLDNALLVWNGDGCRFSSNFANVSGGAVYATGSADLNWNGNGTQFTSNSADDEGGAMFFTEYSGMAMFSAGSTTLFRRNIARENGGAIASVGCYSDGAQFYGGTFIENSAKHGGALYFSSSYFNFTHAIFQSNAASGSGGAVVLGRTTGHFRDTDELPTSMFTRCNFSDNMSEIGGAVETVEGQLELASCFFKGNLAGKEETRHLGQWCGGWAQASIRPNRS